MPSAQRAQAPAPHAQNEPHAIACMEVWGGNRTFDSSVAVPGNDVRVSCVPFVEAGTDRPDNSAGGDLYYVSNCAAGLITRFVLADVAGHGEVVAELARALRTLMRTHINTADHSRLAQDLNQALAAMDLSGRFVTAALLTYFSPTDHLIVCSAGHPRPLLHRHRTGDWHLLDRHAPDVVNSGHSGNPTGIANLPLGILDPTDYEQFAIKLEPGDRVVLYSDAFVEAADPAGRQLGEEGLLDLARQVSNGEGDLAEHLRGGAMSHARSDRLDDDATIIVLTHTAHNPPEPSLRERVLRWGHMLGLGGVDTEV